MRIERLVFASSAGEAAAFGCDVRWLDERLRRPPGLVPLAAARRLSEEGKAALGAGARRTPGDRP